ncbi:hypothetical protein SPBR_06261 [Sporothrix brasiliensis 5110]|uniref:Uncharacterized protein n=1 Tax=Sporothrix brasiliensis 5110 TaxID=1398154 RepID=A0A0C2J5I3_9PEZI|nr:uncharacterized protein SPBR_06261 [Sporothrix brasiliensis 5110]KIH94245.1 hypothetical protein SPBR_06261 [Sporothrix brasiliensis 5110]
MATPRKFFKANRGINTRNVNTRTEGLMRKATFLQKFGARVVVYIELDGESAMFKSHKDINVPSYDACIYGPDHFEYAAGAGANTITTASRQITNTTFPSTPLQTASNPSRAIEHMRQNSIITHKPFSQKATKPLSFFD